MSARLAAALAIAIGIPLAGIAIWFLWFATLSDSAPARPPLAIDADAATAPPRPATRAAELSDLEPIRAKRFVEEGQVDPERPSAGAARVTLLVKDLQGNPVPGASIFSYDNRSDPSGPDGVITISVSPGTKWVSVGAAGFVDGELFLEGSPTEPVEVRLEREVTLVVRVRHEDPATSLAGLQVVFEVGKQTDRHAVEPGKDIRVGGFRHGTSVRVMVEDEHRAALIDEKIALPEDDHVKAVEMVVRSRPRTLRGTIVDEHGVPIVGARISTSLLFPSEAPPDGTFEIPNVFGDTLLVNVRPPEDFAPKRVIVTKLDEPLTIRLERARKLAVELTGGGTDEFEGKITFASDPVDVHTATPRGEGLFWFEAIPRRSGTVRATAANGQSTSVEIGPEETRVTLPRPR